MRRGYLDRCWQLSEGVKILRDGADSVTVAAAEKQRQLDAVFRWGVEHGLTELESAKAVARSRPSNVDRIKDHLRWPEEEEMADRGGFYYRWLCGSSHSNPMVLAEFGSSNPIRQLPDGTRIRAHAVTLGEALQPVTVAIRSLLTAEESSASVKGWESPAYLVVPTLRELLSHQ